MVTLCSTVRPWYHCVTQCDHGNTVQHMLILSQDEFCTYMLLEYQEKDMMAGEKLPPFPYPLKLLHR